jgi:hypothetical protein
MKRQSRLREFIGVVDKERTIRAWCRLVGKVRRNQTSLIRPVFFAKKTRHQFFLSGVEFIKISGTSIIIYSRNEERQQGKEGIRGYCYLPQLAPVGIGQEGRKDSGVLLPATTGTRGHRTGRTERFGGIVTCHNWHPWA